jgi:hypothetical protein
MWPRVVLLDATSRLLVTANVAPNSADSFHPEDGGDTFLRNIDSNKTHTEPQPKRWQSSYYIWHYCTPHVFLLPFSSLISFHATANVVHFRLYFSKKLGKTVSSAVTNRLRPDTSLAVCES